MKLVIISTQPLALQCRRLVSLLVLRPPILSHSRPSRFVHLHPIEIVAIALPRPEGLPTHPVFRPGLSQSCLSDLFIAASCEPPTVALATMSGIRKPDNYFLFSVLLTPFASAQMCATIDCGEDSLCACMGFLFSFFPILLWLSSAFRKHRALSSNATYTHLVGHSVRTGYRNR